MSIEQNRIDLDMMLSLVRAHIFKIEHTPSAVETEVALIARYNLFAQSFRELQQYPSAGEHAILECHAIRLAALALHIVLKVNEPK